MTGLSKKLVLVLIPLLVLLIGCLSLLLFIPDGNVQSVYVEQIGTARKFADSGDYQNAIIYYKNALEENDENEDIYIELAEIYFHLNMREEGLNILRTGVGKLNSMKLISTLNYYNNLEDDSNTEIEKLGGLTVVEFNESNVNSFSTYNYEKYTNECTVKTEHTVSDVYTVEYAQYDAVFEYKNTLENTVINSKTGKPNPYARPTLIRLKRISLLFNGIESGTPVTTDKLKECGATGIKILPYGQNKADYLVTFVLNEMQVKIACDKSGTINDIEAYNEIIPKPVDASELVSKLNGSMINSSNNTGVRNVTLNFRSGTGEKTGSVVESLLSEDGEFSVELDPGDYTMEAVAKGFVTEFYDIFIPEGDEVNQSFSMTPKLGEGQIRFVIEWPETEKDVFIHMKGTPSTGGWVEYTYGTYSTQIGNYERGERDGKRYETATLFDTDGDYEFHVHGADSKQDVIDAGTVVKIYVGNDENPITVKVPDTFSGEYWIVCSIKDGEIKNINGIQE